MTGLVTVVMATLLTAMRHPDNKNPPPMAREEKRCMFLALAPLLLHPPPSIQVYQLLYQETKTMDITGLVGAVVFTVLSVAKSKPQPPHPRQGGHCITTQYLQELPETEALWAFQYMLLIFWFQIQTDEMKF